MALGQAQCGVDERGVVECEMGVAEVEDMASTAEACNIVGVRGRAGEE